MFVLAVDFSLQWWKTTLEEKLVFAASLNYGEKCLGCANDALAMNPNTGVIMMGKSLTFVS